MWEHVSLSPILPLKEEFFLFQKLWDSLGYRERVDKRDTKYFFLKISLETSRMNRQTNVVLLLCIFFCNVFSEFKRFCVGDVMGRLMTL